MDGNVYPLEQKSELQTYLDLTSHSLHGYTVHHQDSPVSAAFLSLSVDLSEGRHGRFSQSYCFEGCSPQRPACCLLWSLPNYMKMELYGPDSVRLSNLGQSVMVKVAGCFGWVWISWPTLYWSTAKGWTCERNGFSGRNHMTELGVAILRKIGYETYVNRKYLPWKVNWLHITHTTLIGPIVQYLDHQLLDKIEIKSQLWIFLVLILIYTV